MPETYILLPIAETTIRIDVTFSAFPDGDTHCVIENTGKVQGERALIVHRLYPYQNEQLMRLILLIDLLKDLGMTDVSVFCPYLPYSRQDKRHLSGEALGAYTLCRMLTRAGCKRLYTIDCHFMRGETRTVYEGLPLISATAADTLLEMCKRKYIGNKPFHIVGPDEGAGLLTRHVGKQHMHKSRGNYVREDKVSKRNVTELTADHLAFVHSTAIIMDDIVSTGTTMLRAVRNLRTKGVTDVYCIVTHGLFLGDSYKELKYIAKGIMASDSVEHDCAVPLVDTVLSEEVIPHWRK